VRSMAPLLDSWGEFVRAMYSASGEERRERREGDRDNRLSFGLPNDRRVSQARQEMSPELSQRSPPESSLSHESEYLSNSHPKLS
jgi:hypothetical protein